MYSSSQERALDNLLASRDYRWLVTGCAGFIGSHLVECLLKRNQIVVGVDNFSTGSKENLDLLSNVLDVDQWKKFTFIEGDLREPSIYPTICSNVEFVLHQAALGSVPQSIADPMLFHENNLSATLRLFFECSERDIPIVFASSCAVYGNEPKFPKAEDHTLSPTSPYATTKLAVEQYAEVLRKTSRLRSIGLRYFNVFGPRQNASSSYAAVIPRWIQSMIDGGDVVLFGDGEQTRDFCHVSDVVKSNLLSALAMTNAGKGVHGIFNIATGQSTSLNQLRALLDVILRNQLRKAPEYRFVQSRARSGDVVRSQADVRLAEKFLGYKASTSLKDGLVSLVKYQAGY